MKVKEIKGFPEREEINYAINMAKLIIKGYEERGGGHSQIEALKTLIKTIKEISNLDIPEPLEKMDERKICPICNGKKEWFVKTAGCMYPCQECEETGFIVTPKLIPLDEKKAKGICEGVIGILQGIKNRHLGKSFHSNRVKADAEQGIDELQTICNKFGTKRIDEGKIIEKELEMLKKGENDWWRKRWQNNDMGKAEYSRVEKFTECGHKKNNTFGSNCKECNMAWLIERCKALEQAIYEIHKIFRGE